MISTLDHASHVLMDLRFVGMDLRRFSVVFGLFWRLLPLRCAHLVHALEGVTSLFRCV